VTLLLEHRLVSVLKVRLFGQVMPGGWPSGVTVTVKLQVAGFPWLLVTVQFTVVVPSGKLFPEGGVQLTVTANPQLFVA
jgi:hypothetical protein